ncbi:MAG TPA: PDZ domain-containing protein, partial [Anaerolineaceae bacterium]
LVGIEPDTAAANSGLIVGDILVGIAGHPVENHEDLLTHLGTDTVGQSLAIEVIRGGEPRTLQVTVGERR